MAAGYPEELAGLPPEALAQLAGGGEQPVGLPQGAGAPPGAPVVEPPPDPLGALENAVYRLATKSAAAPGQEAQMLMQAARFGAAAYLDLVKAGVVNDESEAEIALKVAQAEKALRPESEPSRPQERASSAKS